MYSHGECLYVGFTSAEEQGDSLVDPLVLRNRRGGGDLERELQQ